MRVVDSTNSIQSKVVIVKHQPGAIGMRLLGLGPNLMPTRSLWKLQRLLDQHSFWAASRSKYKLKHKLNFSVAVVSAWNGTHLIGFGRASTDGVFRAVLWDIVVSTEWQGQGIGRRLVENLLSTSTLSDVEKIYLMTTKSGGFYKKLGFSHSVDQRLLVLEKKRLMFTSQSKC
uniref:N-acetyltransferase domain-containing protein n=1 Tax=Paulinella longichromatophora TaxID=1708747 RepID=A0A2H4ZPM4_9EUKA|nr:hypothetical protein PLO_477 [Paulinella longichromatophora]